MGKQFIIWGAKGHALVLADVIYGNGDSIAAFFDREPTATAPLRGVPIFVGMEGFLSWLSGRGDNSGIAAIAAIGGSRGKDRCEYLKLFRKSGLSTPSLIHWSASVSRKSTIGDNCHVLAGAVIAAGTSLGEATIINHNAGVDHECTVEPGVHVAPGATLCGCVRVGAYTLVGAGAVVLPRVKVGANAVVGAGAVVTKDVPNGSVVAGNPARLVKRIDGANEGV